MASTSSSSTASARVARGAGAGALLVVLVGGLPLALVLVAGSPLPTSWPTWAEIQSTFSHPDATGAVLLGLIRWIAWIAWATFAVAVVLEICAALGGVRVPRLRGLAMQQRTAAALVGAVVALVMVAPGAASATASPSVADVSTTSGAALDRDASATRNEAGAGRPGGGGLPDVSWARPRGGPGVEDPRGHTTSGGPAGHTVFAERATVGDTRPGDVGLPDASLRTYTVRPGDSLWGIAESTLGDGALFKQIAELNYGVPQADGFALDSSHWIEPGWVLALPTPAESDAGDRGTATGSDAAVGDSGAGTVPLLPTHTVEVGESLYSIAAERLGDGARYGDILDASLGVVQPDGARLTDPDLIRPGWTVVIPETGAETTATPDDPVPPGSASSSPATGHGADGSAGTTAAPEPSRPDRPAADAPQSPGSDRGRTPESRSDPASTAPAEGEAVGDGTADAVIDAVDAAGPEAGTGRPTGPATDAAPTASPIAPTTVAPGSAPTAEGSHGDRDRSTEDLASIGHATLSASSRTSVTVGGILAAGLVGLVSGRRIAERRRRRAGERVAVPAPTSGSGRFEARLRAVADPLGRDVVDRLLRSLGAWSRTENRPLPDLRAARLAPGRYLEVYLDEPSMLPHPWTSTADRKVWRFTAADAVHLDVRPAATAEAPYPSLVTVGDDDDDAHLMLDLERLGCLDVRGEATAGRAVLAALAIELATSPWADDLQVTLVGTHADMPDVVDTGRLRHVASLESIQRELEARAVDVGVALRDVGATSMADARGRGLLSDAWTPEILLIGESLGPVARGALDRLVMRVPGVGIAAVTHGADTGEWAVDLDDDDPSAGLLLPVGIAIRPQQITEADYAEALGLLRPAPAVPGPPWASSLAAVEEVQLAEIPIVAMSPGSDDPTSIDRAGDDPTSIGTGSGRRRGSAVPLSPVDTVAGTGHAVGAEERGWTEPPGYVPLDGRASPDAEAEPDLDTGWAASGGASPAGAAAVSSASPETPTGAAPDDGTAFDAETDPLGIGPLDLGPLEPLDFGLWDEADLGSDDPEILDDTVPVRDVFGRRTDPDHPRPQAADAEVTRLDTTGPRVSTQRAPVVRVLGPVELEAASGIAMPPSHRRQATELIAYLAFHPGASGSDISAALWPTREPNLATRRSAISRARRWLGTDGVGREYLPRYWGATDERSRDAGTGTGYRLRGVSTDWQEFLDLVGEDVTTTPLSRLREALTMVRGPVFHGVPPRKYVWAEALFQDMTAGVVDVAHEVARRALRTGDVATARYASQVGRLVDPADERVWRDGIRAEWAGGRPEAITRLVERLRDHLDSLDLDPDPETEDLVAEVEDLRRPTRSRAGRGAGD